MQARFLQHLNAGVALVTPSRRLASLLADRYHVSMLDARQVTWESPLVFPFVGWLTQIFQDLAVLDDAMVSGSILLSPEQERIVWEQVVREGDGAESEQAESLAVLAMTAWSTAALWDLPLTAIADIGGRQEVRAFVRWATRFRQRCGDLNAIDLHSFAAQLAVRDSLRLDFPTNFRFFGYPRLPHLLRRIEQQFGDVARLPASSAHPHNDPLDYRAFVNREVELATAMRWASELKRSRPQASVSVALAGAQRIDANLEQRLQRAYSSAPGRSAGVRQAQLYCPVAVPLADVAIVQSALLILDPRRSRPWDEVSRLLLTPYLGEADQEREQRALLDVQLRRRSNVEVKLSSVIDAARNGRVRCPQLVKRLEAVARGAEDVPSRRRMHDWMTFVEKQLAAAGWPGEHELNRSEQVALTEWHRAMDAAAELDAVLPTGTWISAFSRWRAILRSRRSLPPAEVNAVQVVTLEEAAYLESDALWVAGMHDGAWIESPSVSPLLPFSLQRTHGLPGADPNVELANADGIVDRLRAGHPTGIWSYAKVDGETPQRKIPMVACVAVAASPVVSWPRGKIPYDYDLVDDTYATSLRRGSTITGGVGVFTDQAACPMRAFGRHRLRTQSPEDASPGLNAIQRGNLIHALMARFWARVQSSAELRQIGEQGIRQMLTACATQVVDEYRVRYHLFDMYWELEEERLRELGREWLQLELERGEFDVLACEQSRSATIGGQTINTRIDRIDRLENGQIVMIDYKTGEVPRSSWLLPRPDQPQLPLYAVSTNAAEVGGIAFARLKKGNCKVVDEPNGVLHGNAVGEQSASAWELQLEQWRTALEELSSEIETGFALAEPKRGAVTCRYCDLHCFCRIHESRPSQVLENDDDG